MTQGTIIPPAVDQDSIEYGHVYANYVKSVADTPGDPDADPDIIHVNGQVTFESTFPGAYARGSIRLPAEPRAYGLIVTGDTFQIVESKLVDHEGREGVRLIASVDDVPISWQAVVTLEDKDGRTIYNKAYTIHRDSWTRVGDLLEINLPDLIPSPGRLEPPEGVAIRLAEVALREVKALHGVVVLAEANTVANATSALESRNDAEEFRNTAVEKGNAAVAAEERVSIEHEHIHQDVNHVDDAAAQVAAAIRQANVFAQNQVPPYLQQEVLNDTYALKGKDDGGGGIFLDTDGQPYFDLTATGGGSIVLDTDGVPYIKIGL